MSDQAKVIRFFELHLEAMQIGLDMLKGEPSSNGATVTFTPPVTQITTRAQTLNPPKKKAAKKATKKRAKAADLDDDDDEDDEDDDDQPTQKMTPAVSMGDAVEKVGRFIAAKVGLGQSFTGDDARKLFDGGIESGTLTYAMNQWINRGVVERVSKGNVQKPSTFKKIQQIKGED